MGMMEWSKALMRRQRVLTVSKISSNPKTSPPPRRRRITARIRAARAAVQPSPWCCRPVPGFMGKVFDRPFYSCQFLPGKPLVLPFAPQSFVCLINASSYVSDEHFKALALSLLQQRMRAAICCGIESERLNDLLNELLEDGQFHDNGRTAMATAYEDDPLEEVMEYFALPAGIASTSLLLSIGDDRMFKSTLQTFSSVIERMHLHLCL
ncbi:MAG: hypothetical protein V1918_03525 [Planctomycetota bacterium]